MVIPTPEKDKALEVKKYYTIIRFEMSNVKQSPLSNHYVSSKNKQQESALVKAENINNLLHFFKSISDFCKSRICDK